ncbi:hypothetical protein BKA62DRAFT_616979 [Auriculariales sp. MPI-PUGE-AT-0066]|nr:hypothetical protein BKA62DRAFT_616979 [Auriculariales sp. MPI-PUGE-AT-0066]
MFASPKKKRVLVDDSVTTPKRQRVMRNSTPSSGTSATTPSSSSSALPSQLARIQSLQQVIQSALAQGLATSGIAPDLDTGRVPNVINHVGLAASAGSMLLSFVPTEQDIRRICWMWEWDAKALPSSPTSSKTSSAKAGPTAGDVGDDDDNPFLVPSALPQHSSKATPSDWRRGGMGFVLSPTTHFVRSDNRRVPAYGIGIQADVQGDIDQGIGYGSGKVGGMASLARWTSEGKRRMKELERKLERWLELHPEIDAPLPPLADLPPLIPPAAPKEDNPKRAELTEVLMSPSPGGTMRHKLRPSLEAPGSPTRASPSKRPFPTLGLQQQRIFSSPSRVNSRIVDEDDNMLPRVPFPSLGAVTTPSRGLPPQTPSTNRIMGPPSASPTKGSPTKGSDAGSVPTTPSTSGRVTPTSGSSRRDALYERVRKRSESNNSTPTTKRIVSAPGTPAHTEEMDKLRKAALLSRLADVAESVWMLFSNSSTANISSSASGLAMGRRRRSMQASEVVRAVKNSSAVPISESEAHDSLTMICDLCPFFLKHELVNGDGWFEMPASSSTAVAPPSPGAPSALELLSRSPIKVKNEAGSLREVRERIQRELRNAE